MKIYLTITLFFSFFNLFFCQTEKKTLVFYNYTYKLDSTNETKKYDETMVLAIHGKESIYKSYNRIKRDSIVEGDFKKGNYVVDFSTLPKSYVFHQVYYNKGNDSIKVFDKIVNKEFSYEPSSRIVWQLGTSKKKIGEFECQNAFCYIGKRKFEAWFTNSIYVNEGPYRFKGLPGLIVEVYDEKKYFHFSLVGIKNSETPITYKVKATETNEEKFLKLRKDFYKDPVGQSQIYIGRPVSEENKQRVINNFKGNLFLEQ
jgi:GLPGLI family protein